MTGGVFASGLIAIAVFLPSLSTPSDTQGLEVRLCASGRILRIDLPGQNEPEQQAPMPCHAVCARDDDGPVKSKRKKTPA